MTFLLHDASVTLQFMHHYICKPKHIRKLITFYLHFQIKFSIETNLQQNIGDRKRMRYKYR